MPEARAQHVTVNEEALTLDLVDGRTITVPLMWYPRLWHGTSEERDRFEIFGAGIYISWPDIVLSSQAGEHKVRPYKFLIRWNQS